jgi:hypothetical protein
VKFSAPQLRDTAEPFVSTVGKKAVIRDPAIAVGLGQFGAIQAVAPSLGVEVTPVNVRDPGEIERAITAFARTSAAGPLLQATRTVPIVFAIVADPVGAGFVDSLARPGGQHLALSQKPSASELDGKRHRPEHKASADAIRWKLRACFAKRPDHEEGRVLRIEPVGD